LVPILSGAAARAVLATAKHATIVMTIAQRIACVVFEIEKFMIPSPIANGVLVDRESNMPSLFGKRHSDFWYPKKAYSKISPGHFLYCLMITK
jgi:hypothetical protein